MIVALSSIILAIPTTIANENKINQNSLLFFASSKLALLPFFIKNSSVLVGFPMDFFIASESRKDMAIIGMSKLAPRTRQSTLDPQNVKDWNVRVKRKESTKKAA